MQLHFSTYVQYLNQISLDGVRHYDPGAVWMMLHQSVLGKVDTAKWTLLWLVDTRHKVRTEVLTLTRVPTTVRTFNVDQITDIDMYLHMRIHTHNIKEHIEMTR